MVTKSRVGDLSLWWRSRRRRRRRWWGARWRASEVSELGDYCILSQIKSATLL